MTSGVVSSTPGPAPRDDKRIDPFDHCVARFAAVCPIGVAARCRPACRWPFSVGQGAEIGGVIGLFAGYSPLVRS